MITCLRYVLGDNKESKKGGGAAILTFRFKIILTAIMKKFLIKFKHSSNILEIYHLNLREFIIILLAGSFQFLKQCKFLQFLKNFQWFDLKIVFFKTNIFLYFTK